MPKESQGVGALKTAKFSEVTLAPAPAIQLLRKRAITIITGNLDRELLFRQKHLTWIDGKPFEQDKIEEKRANLAINHPATGVELSATYLNTVYQTETKETVTFNDVVNSHFATLEKDLSLQAYRRQNELPSSLDKIFASIKFVGFLTDLLQIIDPQTANYNDGVAVILERSRMSQYVRAHELGRMIYDTISGTIPAYREKYDHADREGAKELRESLLAQMTEDEVTDFTKGFTERQAQTVFDRSKIAFDKRTAMFDEKQQSYN